MPTPAWIGVDFGTTNSAVAFIDPAGSRRGSPSSPPRSVPVRRFRPFSTSNQSAAVGRGAEAIERYLASETKGRFIQSLKAYLADRTFEGTGIGTQHYSLES